jgi:hypothetical protein
VSNPRSWVAAREGGFLIVTHVLKKEGERQVYGKRERTMGGEQLVVLMWNERATFFWENFSNFDSVRQLNFLFVRDAQNLSDAEARKNARRPGGPDRFEANTPPCAVDAKRFCRSGESQCGPI